MSRRQTSPFQLEHRLAKPMERVELVFQRLRAKALRYRVTVPEQPAFNAASRVVLVASLEVVCAAITQVQRSARSREMATKLILWSR